MPDALTLTVTDLAVHTPTTRRLRLALDGVPFAFAAGQGVAIGVHGQPERRPYSIACAPDDARDGDALEFLLRADAGGGLGRHLDGLGPGTHVDLEGPFGRFTLPAPVPAVPLLFLGGGTGIAPLRAMMRDARAHGHAAPIHLVYSVRTLDDVAFADEWDSWVRDGLGEVGITVTRPPGRKPADTSHRLDLEAIAPLVERSPGVLCFICGPPGFVHDLEQALSHLGVRADRIRREGW